MELTPEHKHLTVRFDSGEVATATVVVEVIKKFNGKIGPQIIDIKDYQSADTLPSSIEEISEIVICSVNETYELSWYSEYWGFEYELTTQPGE